MFILFHRKSASPLVSIPSNKIINIVEDQPRLGRRHHHSHIEVSSPRNTPYASNSSVFFSSDCVYLLYAQHNLRCIGSLSMYD